MQIIDFNSPDFKGFSQNEHILVDTGILLALFNPYDAFHDTVVRLFHNHIVGVGDQETDHQLFFYLVPTTVNEITHLASTKISIPAQHPYHQINGPLSEADVESRIVSEVHALIDGEVFDILDGDKDSVLKQIELYTYLGSADAVNASIAHSYGISLLTVDRKLSQNINANHVLIPDIDKVYYTTGRHRS